MENIDVRLYENFENEYILVVNREVLIIISYREEDE